MLTLDLTTVSTTLPPENAYLAQYEDCHQQTYFHQMPCASFYSMAVGPSRAHPLLLSAKQSRPTLTQDSPHKEVW